MQTIKTIRYMGNKTKLLNEIIPIIQDNYNYGSCVCDLMAGTNTVAYALKDYYRLITNDIQIYSKTISDTIICNKANFDLDLIKLDFDKFYEENNHSKNYDFFEKNYSDKYFSGEQCLQIDSIRYAIENIHSNKSAQLTALMYAMNLAQSTPGHFAQFLPHTHPRVKKLREIDIYNVFFTKLAEFESLSLDKKNNLSYSMDYKELLELDIIQSVDVFYIDTPYTGEQYSRFYHVLDTIVKYDYPDIAFKAGYRNDRFKSNFSYKTRVKDEFDFMIKKISNLNKDILLSYSNKGLISIDELHDIFKKYYVNIKVKEIGYNHSTQGKGSVKVKEVIILAKCKED